MEGACEAIESTPPLSGIQIKVYVTEIAFPWCIEHLLNDSERKQKMEGRMQLAVLAKARLSNLNSPGIVDTFQLPLTLAN